MMEELTQIIAAFHDKIDKKEYFSYVKSCYKSNEDRGYITLVLDMKDESGNFEINRNYKSLDDIKKIGDPSIANMISLIESYDRDSEFVLFTGLKYQGKLIQADVRSFKSSD